MMAQRPAQILAGVLMAAASLGATALADHVPPPFVVENVPLDIQWAGRTMAVDVSPLSDAKWLAATESGGLFVTLDSGDTWSRIDSLPVHLLNDVAYAPNAPGTILVTSRPGYEPSGSGGIWYSSSDGAAWVQITGIIPNCHGGSVLSAANEIAFDPAGNFVYVATDCGVAISNNNGAPGSWSHRSRCTGGSTFACLPGTTNAQEHSITVQSGAVTVCGEDGLHRSSDSGANWTTAYDPRESARQSGDVCRESGFHTLSGSSAESNVVYVAVRELDDNGNLGSQLYEVAFDGSNNPTSSVRLDTVPNNNRPPVVSVHQSQGTSNNFYSVYFSNGVDAYYQQCDSANGRCGNTTDDWIETTLQHKDTADFAFGTGTNCPLAMANDGGVLKTYDCGLSWVAPGPTYLGLNALQLYDVAVQAYTDHTDIYITTMDNGNHASSNSGATWPHKGGGAEGLHLEVPRTPPPHDDQIISYTGCADCFGRVSEEHYDNSVIWTGPEELNPARGFPGQLVIEHDAFISVMDRRACSWDTSRSCTEDIQCARCGGTGASCLTNLECLPFATTCDVTPNDCTNQDYRVHLLEGLGTSWVDRLTLNRVPRNARVQFSGPLSDPVLYMGMIGVAWSAIALERIDNIRTGTPTITPADDNMELGAHWQGYGCFDCPKGAYAAHPTMPNVLLAVGTDGRLYRSTTSGASPDGGITPGWIADDAATSTINAGYLYRRITQPIDNGNLRREPNIRILEYDPADPNIVFAGLAQGGVFWSHDGGTDWEQVPGSEQILNVTGFAFDQISGDVYVSSYGRGLWKLRKIDLMLPPEDAFEPNDESYEAADLDLTFHRHYDPRVAEDRSRVFASQELWNGGYAGLTLHDRDDVDRFRVAVVNPADHVPDLPDGPLPDPMPTCGEITRLTSPRSPLITDQPDTIMFRGMIEVTTTITNDDKLDVIGFPSSGTDRRRLIPCPILTYAPGFDFTVGDRSGLAAERTVFPTYGVNVEWRVDITRISEEARWLAERLEGPRESERVFPLPCLDGFFPECPSPMGGPVQIELEHPIVPDCTADGPGCRMFHPFWWSSDNAIFELAFSSAIDQSYELWNEQGQRIAEAVEGGQNSFMFNKVLSVPDLQPGFYALVITGPQGVFTMDFTEFPKPIDTDGDGIADPFDGCPTVAEDFDGVRDGDGCSEAPGDIDGDNIPDVQDNCPDTYDPQTTDSDNDGRGDACDCAANDPTVWEPPLEVENLSWPSKFEMNWSPAAGGSGTVYEILRGNIGDGPFTANGGDTCMVGNLGGTSFQDGSQPQPPGFRYQVRARNACGTGPLGNARGSAADCSVQSCAHSKCATGVNLFAGCDTCVTQICAVDPYCCDTEWDSICVDRVLGDCGLMTCADNGSSCTHDVCTTGAPLVDACDAAGNDCVSAVCDLDPYCCDKEWDDLCRVSVELACGATCE